MEARNVFHAKVEYPLVRSEYEPLLEQIDSQWSVLADHHLERTWKFDDFEKGALEFVNIAGDFVNKKHIMQIFNYLGAGVKTMIWTHKIDGLTESDFILAAKFDEI